MRELTSTELSAVSGGALIKEVLKWFLTNSAWDGAKVWLDTYPAYADQAYSDPNYWNYYNANDPCM